MRRRCHRPAGDPRVGSGRVQKLGPAGRVGSGLMARARGSGRVQNLDPRVGSGLKIPTRVQLCGEHIGVSRTSYWSVQAQVVNDFVASKNGVDTGIVGLASNCTLQ